MLDFIREHWITVSAVSLTLVVVWIAALLSKYVRLMLNIIRDTPPPLLMGPFDFERVEGRAVTFRAFDGTTLRGMFLSKSMLPGQNRCDQKVDSQNSTSDETADYLNDKTRGVIVFCHEYGSDLYSCMRYCRPLLEAGFDIFTFDFRAHGRSGTSPGYEPRLWPSDKEVSDCLGALALVQSELEDRKLDVSVGLFGISRGAGAAIMAAEQARHYMPVKAVIADSAFSTDTTLEWSMKRWVHIFARVRFVYENHPPVFWRFIRWLLLRFARVRFKCRFPSVRKKVAKSTHTPHFFIHGEKDSYIKPDQAELLYSIAHRPRYLWIVPQAKHNQSVVVEPDHYAARTVMFFEKYIIESPLSKPDPSDGIRTEAFDFFRLNEHTSCPGDTIPALENKEPTIADTADTISRSRRELERTEALETVRKSPSKVSADPE